MSYGDSSLFVGRMLINVDKMKITHDSYFKICQQFYMTDFVTLQMLGMVTSKNNLVVGMFYPRATYLYSSKTALLCGMSTGSVKKMLIGATYIHSPSLLYGFQSQYCAHQNKISSKISFKENLSQSTIFTAGIELNQSGLKSKNSLELLNSKVNFSLTKRNDISTDCPPVYLPFTSILNKHKFSVNLSADNVETSLVQTSSFESISVKSIVGVSAVITQDKC